MLHAMYYLSLKVSNVNHTSSGDGGILEENFLQKGYSRASGCFPVEPELVKTDGVSRMPFFMDISPKLKRVRIDDRIGLIINSSFGLGPLFWLTFICFLRWDFFDLWLLKRKFNTSFREIQRIPNNPNDKETVHSLLLHMYIWVSLCFS